jgi:hypothetical protein
MKTPSVVISLALVVLSGMMAAPVLAEVTVCPPLPAPKAVVKNGGKVLVSGKQNSSENLQRSRCMIELILDDLATNYAAVGGGGISSIKAISSTSYIVSLPQEERVDLLTYEFDVKTDGSVSIKRKFVASRSGAGQSAGGDPLGK